MVFTTTWSCSATAWIIPFYVPMAYIFWLFARLEYTNEYYNINAVIWDFWNKIKLYVTFPRMQEENCLNNLVFSLLAVLKIKSTSAVDGDKLLYFFWQWNRNISEGKKLLLGLNNIEVEFYTEFEVDFKTKISNTKTGNWRLSISKLNIMIPNEMGKERQGESKPPNLLANRLMKRLNTNKSVCLAKWYFGESILSSLISQLDAAFCMNSGKATARSWRFVSFPCIS